jgi:hypothetical protein
MRSTAAILILLFLLSACLLGASCKKQQVSADSGIVYSGTATLSEPRSWLAAAATGNTAIFAGGIDFATGSTSSSTVDIYDAATGSWTTARLSEPRYSPSGAGAAGKILIAGGYDNVPAGQLGTTSSTVDIYDTESGTWSAAQLSAARVGPAAVGLGNKILFAGGVSPTTGSSNTVDIYDVPSNTWTTARLSVPRWDLAAAAAGTKVVFAGGTNGPALNTVDIYDISTGAWSTSQLSDARLALAGAAAGNKIVFAGGTGNNGPSQTVDIYDVSTGAWSMARLSVGREQLAAATIGNKIFFGGGNYLATLPGGYIVDSGDTDTVDVYDAAANRWGILRLSKAQEMLSATSVGNKLLFAGGAIATNPGNTSLFYTSTGTADIFTVNGQ